MRKLIFLLLFIPVFASAQIYQRVPQSLWMPRLKVDSVLSFPLGLGGLRNLSDGRDTGQVRYYKTDSSVYIWTGYQWRQVGGSTYTGTAPISISATVISMAAATGSTNGYLTSTDWNTFNNKPSTLQQVFNTETGGAVLTKNDTIAGGGFNWRMINMGITSIVQSAKAAVTGSNGTAHVSPLIVTGGAGGATSYSPAGTVTGGNAGAVNITSGNGGAITGTPTTGIGGSGGDINLLAGDGGLGTTLGGTAGSAILQAGTGGGGTSGGAAGYVSLKGGLAGSTGNASGGNIFLIPGTGNGTGKTGTTFLGVSPSYTIRGNTVIGNSSDNYTNLLQVNGSVNINKDSLAITTGKKWKVMIDTATGTLVRDSTTADLSAYLPLVGAAYTTTTGDGLALTTSTLTTGNLMKLTNTSTVNNGAGLLSIVSSGANSTASKTTYGQQISVTNTGTTSTNVGLSVTASGATNNYAALFTGNVGIGNTSPGYKLDVTGTANVSGATTIGGNMQVTGTTIAAAKFIGVGGGGLSIGNYTGSSTIGALWSNAVTPSSSNYIIGGDANNNYINAPSSGSIYFSLGDVAKWQIDASTGIFHPSTNNTIDIGDASHTVRDLFLGRNATIGGTLGVTGTTTLNGAIAAADGANKSVGVSAAMTAGTITISNTRVTANSRIFLTHASLGGTQGILSVGTIVAGTSFVINSSSATDTGTVNWIIIN